MLYNSRRKVQNPYILQVAPYPVGVIHLNNWPVDRRNDLSILTLSKPVLKIYLYLRLHRLDKCVEKFTVRKYLGILL